MSLVSIFESGNSASAFNSFAVRSDAFIISAPFRGGCLASGNDPDDFLADLFRDCARHDQNGDAASEPQYLPSLFAFLKTVLYRQMIRIVKYQARGFEADAVLSYIRSPFVRVPFKAHPEAPLAWRTGKSSRLEPIKIG